ncbi:MAG TPA: helix-turn-helix domain-containing protein [Roseiarcus sp.]|nr:helix-turn-helix domain-containing protein [Roseiarcus sp.]
MPHKMQNDDLSRLAQGIAAGLSCREIAARLGVSPATAIRWTKRCGLVSQRSRRLAPETRAALRRALSDGAAPAEAAARFGVSLRTAERLRDPADAEARRRLLDEIRAGAPLEEAAARAGVSALIAARWTRGAELAISGHRRDVEARALAAMEGGMSAEQAAAAFALSPASLVRLARRPRLSPERLKRRQQLFAALASGLSCRKAAAALNMPVATAIRWARQRPAQREGENNRPTDG